ncbi:MAG TPA: GPP34 family phosphoprotein, partial [Dehalococcoidia bacterium]|nr:GPP34 family phosphoprotein [Dehalococcoidia bacterium]
MESDAAHRPAASGHLSAPAAYVLLHGPDAARGEAFKYTLLELVARRALILAEGEEIGPFRRPRRVAVLARGPAAAPPDAALADVWDLYQGLPGRTFRNGVTGVPIAEIAQAAWRRYKGLGQFGKRIILPSLIEDGYFALRERRVLGLFPTRSYALTPTGEAARADLRSQLERGERDLPDALATNPAGAAALVAGIGPAVLLMSAAYPDLQRLNRELRAGAGDGDATGAVAASTSGAPAEVQISDDLGSEPTADSAPLSFELPDGFLSFDLDF